MQTHENELSEKEIEALVEKAESNPASPEVMEFLGSHAEVAPGEDLSEIPPAPAKAAELSEEPADDAPTPASEAEQDAQDRIDAMIEAQREEAPAPAYDMQRQAVMPVGGSFPEKSGTAEERQRTLPIGGSA